MAACCPAAGNAPRATRFAGVVVALVIHLLLLTGPGQAVAGQAVLAWDANTEPDVSGYKIHYGRAPGAYDAAVDAGLATTHTVTGLADGQTYYFAATAYDVNRNESGYSNEVSYTTPKTVSLSLDGVPGGGDSASSTPVHVTIGSSTSGTQIRYTTDGTTPSATVGTELANGGTVAVGRSLTLKAIGYKPGWTATAVARATFTLTVGPVTLTPAGGTFSAPQAVTIASPTQGALIRYTTDGTVPSATAGTQLANGGVVIVDRPLTLRAIGCRDGWTNSAVASGTYSF